MARLQKHWGNSIKDEDWKDIELMTDDELDKSISNISGQVEFDWAYGIFTSFFCNRLWIFDCLLIFINVSSLQLGRMIGMHRLRLQTASTIC